MRYSIFDFASFAKAVQTIENGDELFFEKDVNLPRADGALKSPLPPIEKAITVLGNGKKLLGEGNGVGLIFSKSCRVENLYISGFTVCAWVRPNECDTIKGMTFSHCTFGDMSQAGVLSGNHACNTFISDFTIKNCLFTAEKVGTYPKRNTQEVAFAAIISGSIGLGKGTTIENANLDGFIFENNVVLAKGETPMFEGVFVYNTYDLTYAALLPDYEAVMTAKKHTVQNSVTKRVIAKNNRFDGVGDGSFCVINTTIGPYVKNCEISDVTIENNEVIYELVGMSIGCADIYNFGEEIIEISGNVVKNVELIGNKFIASEERPKERVFAACVGTVLLEAGHCVMSNNRAENVKMIGNSFVGGDVGIRLEAAHAFRNESRLSKLYENDIDSVTLKDNGFSSLDVAIAVHGAYLDGRHDGMAVHSEVPTENGEMMSATENRVKNVEIKSNKSIGCNMFVEAVGAAAAGGAKTERNSCENVEVSENEVLRGERIFVHTTSRAGEILMESACGTGNYVEVCESNNVVD